MTKNISAKSLLRKANSNAGTSVKGFIEAYREYMLQNISEAVPVIQKIDNGSLPLTNAMSEIKNAIFAHVQALDLKAVEDSLNRVNEPSHSKNFSACILNAKNEVQNQKDFNMPQEAERWVDRQLDNGATDWRGEVYQCRSDGLELWSNINRNDAVSRVMREQYKPGLYSRPTSGGKLSFGVKAKQTRVTFSHG